MVDERVLLQAKLALCVDHHLDGDVWRHVPCICAESCFLPHLNQKNPAFSLHPFSPMCWFKGEGWRQCRGMKGGQAPCPKPHGHRHSVVLPLCSGQGCAYLQGKRRCRFGLLCPSPRVALKMWASCAMKL